VRLSGAATGHSGGLGLGLAIVRRTTELLQHPLSLRSQPGRGTCFEIRVPCLPSAAATDGIPALPRLETHGEARRQRLQDQFVVLVDDDPANLAAMEALCITWGCLVLTAPHAEAALAALEQELRVPDLLVTDMRLGPGLDGLALVAALREQVESPVPALLVTAETDPALALRAQQQGVALLNKPAGAERLLAAMADLLPPAENAESCPERRP
jgi:CheY-like chemotaxis protein